MPVASTPAAAAYDSAPEPVHPLTAICIIMPVPAETQPVWVPGPSEAEVPVPVQALFVKVVMDALLLLHV